MASSLSASHRSGMPLFVTPGHVTQHGNCNLTRVGKPCFFCDPSPVFLHYQNAFESIFMACILIKNMIFLRLTDSRVSRQLCGALKWRALMDRSPCWGADTRFPREHHACDSSVMFRDTLPHRLTLAHISCRSTHTCMLAALKIVQLAQALARLSTPSDSHHHPVPPRPRWPVTYDMKLSSVIMPCTCSTCLDT